VRHSAPHLTPIAASDEIEHGGGRHLEFSLKSDGSKFSFLPFVIEIR